MPCPCLWLLKCVRPLKTWPRDHSGERDSGDGGQEMRENQGQGDRGQREAPPLQSWPQGSRDMVLRQERSTEQIYASRLIQKSKTKCYMGRGWLMVSLHSSAQGKLAPTSRGQIQVVCVKMVPQYTKFEKEISSENPSN